MSAFDEYLQEYQGELAFDLGSITESLAADPGNKRAWVGFSLGVSKQIWSALPTDVRSVALFALQDQIQIIEDSTDLAVSGATDAIMGAAGVVEAIPIAGAIIEGVLVVVTITVDTVKGLQGVHYAQSKHELNREQRATFEAVTDPSQWALGNYSVRRYERYYWPSERINKQKWRRRPCIVPSYRDPTVWGLPSAPEAVGSCDPGRRVTRKLGTYDFTSEGGQNCVSFAAISSLFWPFWSTNHKAKPISVYGEEVYPDTPGLFIAPTVDPNEILVTRQQAILSNPVTNMRVRGERLRDAQSVFVRYFRDKVYGMRGMIEMRGNEVKLRPTTADATGSGTGPIDRWRIDPIFNPEHEFGGPVHYYWNKNGMIENYGRGPDLTEVGVPAFAPSQKRYQDLGYSAAQLNTVVASVKGFFTARTAMLQQPYAMRALLRTNPARLFDPRVRNAMRESAARV